MTKKEFENIVVKSLPPVLKSNLNKHKNSINENDFDIISKDLLIRAIKDFGLSLDNGLKLVRYYFDEILILYNGGKSEVYPGKTIINFESKTIGHVNNGRCEFKYTFWAIERFNRTLKLCEEQLNNQLNSTGKTVKGFDLNLPEDKIRILFDNMNTVYFNTDFDNFKLLFNNSELNNFETINKTKKFTNALLIYFTSKLFSTCNPLDYVKITEFCFQVKNLSQSQNNSQKPKGSNDIDIICSEIK